MALTEDELRRQAELLEQLKVLAEKVKEEFKQTLDTAAEQKAVLDNVLGITSKIEELKKQMLEEDGRSKVLDAEKIKNLSDYLEYSKQILEIRRQQGLLTAEEYAQALKDLELLEKQKDVLKEEEQAAIGMVSATLQLGNNQKGIFNQVEKINQISKLNLNNEDRKAELLKMQKQFVDELLGKITDAAKKMFEIATEFDSTIKNLMRSANFTFEEGMRGMINTQLAMGGAAVPIDKLGESMISLKENFTAYTTLTGSERTKVEAMVAVLDKMGLSADASSKFLDTATKSLGMSLGQSKNFLSSLKGFADQAGLSMQRVSQVLAANASQLANFGKEGVRVFKELEQASKQLGIEMSKLFQVTEQFTTFEGAADAAAKFNALLGGDFINSVNLLNASMNNPIDAFAQFKEAMDNSGTSFEDLDNGMKRVMAQAIGMSVEEAGKLFSQDITTATRAMREQAAEQEKLNKMSGAMTDFMDQLKSAFVALYPAIVPLLESMKEVGEALVDIAAGISKFVKENEEMISVLKVMGGIIFGIAGAVLVVTTVLLPFAATWVSIKVLFGGIGGLLKFMFAPLKALAGLLPAVGGGAAGAAPGVTALGAALSSAALGVLALGAGIGLAAFGLSFLVDSFKGLGTDGPAAADAVMKLVLAMGGMVAVLILLGSVAAPGLAVMQGIALAAVAIGTGIGIAAAGISLVIDSEAKLLTAGKATLDSMNDLKQTTVDKYGLLVVAFRLIADEMERISNTGVIDKLSNFDFATIAAPSSKLEFSVGSQSQQGSTSITQEKQQIAVNVKIDSPIQLNGRELGRFIAEDKSVIEAVNKALDGARK